MENMKTERVNRYFEAAIPENLELPPLLMTSVLTNLLDNADEALSRVNGDRELSIRMFYAKNVLAITIENTFDGVLLKTGAGIQTRKRDDENHGIGLKNVETQINEQGGELEIEIIGTVFAATVRLYVQKW